MLVLVINSGSSSLKYQLIDMAYEKCLAKGVCDRIGLEMSFVKHTNMLTSKSEVIESDLYNHKVAISEVISALTNSEYGVINNMKEIHAVGHRLVHGGEKFKSSVLIDVSVMETINDCIDLAPLHNPPNIIGIEACKEIMPHIPMIAVFDTAFHQTMPQHAYLYALPYEFYKKYSIRKYGFHGTSHKYVGERAADMLGKPFDQLKIITCHLGNGASICAIKNGKSYDTTMGFTPLEGLAMGTRSGNIDPAIISFLMDKENLSVKEVTDILNKKSGVLGVSGVSSDFRDIEDAAEKGNSQAKLANDIFVYKVKRYIGDFAAAMGGVDCIVFTAGVGENNIPLRLEVVEGLEFLGIKVDAEKNNIRGEETDISTDDATVRTLVVPTNEELAIAREVKRVLN